MHGYRLAYVTPDDVPRWKRGLLYSPTTRLTSFFLLFVGLAIAGRFALTLSGFDVRLLTPLRFALELIAVEWVPAVLAYFLLVRWLENRPVAELAWAAIPRQLPLGLLAGSLLFSAIVGVQWLAGSYHVVGLRSHPDWLPELLGPGLCAGLAEEIVMRGVLFRIVEEGLGTWIAAPVSAVVFGAMHWGNPGATLWSCGLIAIEMGLLLAMVYHVTRSLWTCIGLHAAWNLMQGLVFGIPVSGEVANGLLVSKLTGPDWLSGGAFGSEGSLVALALGSACTLGLVWISLRRDSIVPPSWKRTPVAMPDAWDRLDRIR